MLPCLLPGLFAPNTEYFPFFHGDIRRLCLSHWIREFVYTIHTMCVHRSVHVHAPQIRSADCLDPSHHEHQECLCRSHQDSDQTL